MPTLKGRGLSGGKGEKKEEKVFGQEHRMEEAVCSGYVEDRVGSAV
jgi:hypothetical protein